MAVVALVVVVISVIAAHIIQNKISSNPKDVVPIAVIEREVANGWHIDLEAKPNTLNAIDRSRYALQPNSSYRVVDISSGEWQGIIPGGEAWIEEENGIAQTGGIEEVRSPWAVWATKPLLSRDECNEWVRHAEMLELETGDFVFAGGEWGTSRLHTGARRHSATRKVEDSDFAALMKQRLIGQVPEALVGGRKYGGPDAAAGFLVSKYVPDQYFAPHFDGRGSGGYSETHTAEFTVVLYLTDDFVGGATHYLPGQGSEVAQAVAVRPNLGCASIHRQGTVLHSGGEVLHGIKYIIQFFLYYESGVPEHREMANLRWGA